MMETKIFPIVEYAELDCAGPFNDSYEIFDISEWGEHTYWGKIFNRLKESYGLYVFYDSVSKPLYVGIAQKQTLWKRANQSYNEYRDRNLRILRVDHPHKNVQHDPKKIRPVKRNGFTLADVSTYFSAYEVSENLLGGLEAFAVRAFGGTLLNTKM